MSEYECVGYDVSNGIATATLRRPGKLNAFNDVMLRELHEILDEVRGRDEVRVLILTGEGRAFCVGADLNWFDVSALGREPTPKFRATAAGTHGVFDQLEALEKPVIAAINGPAVGFGVTMTLPMDIRIASSAARMGFVFARRGVVPEACSTWFLPRLVGMQRAAEWVYTGRVFGAEEALAGGLVSRVVPPEALLPTALALAREIADNTSAVSVALARQMMWKLLGTDHPMEGHRLDSRGMAWTGSSADAREGIASFLEKRPPRFTLKPSRDMPPFYPWWSERSFK